MAQSKRTDISKFSVISENGKYQLDIISSIYEKHKHHEIGAEITINPKLPWHHELDLFLRYIFIPHELDYFSFTLEKDEIKNLLQTLKTFQLQHTERADEKIACSHKGSLRNYHLECACFAPPHIVSLTLDKEDECAYISLNKNIYLNIWERITNSISQFLYARSKKCLFDTWMLKETEYNDLIHILEDFISEK